MYRLALGHIDKMVYSDKIVSRTGASLAADIHLRRNAADIYLGRNAADIYLVRNAADIYLGRNAADIYLGITFL